MLASNSDAAAAATAAATGSLNGGGGRGGSGVGDVGCGDHHGNAVGVHGRKEDGQKHQDPEFPVQHQQHYTDAAAAIARTIKRGARSSSSSSSSSSEISFSNSTKLNGLFCTDLHSFYFVKYTHLKPQILNHSLRLQCSSSKIEKVVHFAHQRVHV
jgi:hypothetical protein